jgi:hypothetical protein
MLLFSWVMTTGPIQVETRQTASASGLGGKSIKKQISLRIRDSPVTAGTLRRECPVLPIPDVVSPGSRCSLQSIDPVRVCLLRFGPI